ncbi:hypothetical protein DFR47_11116 [Pseudochrobactrum asaccharolyticum]|uniref:Uncharacterized protein n=1 Tax=Pseudochrobactrum asaccharolyticum TaxID=354351 RepID=A0A366DLI8_9HYPH|nr:hypothetical protein DFR47_11116 [Pseudochrobactrum asaccharolyticum]
MKSHERQILKNLAFCVTMKLSFTDTQQVKLFLLRLCAFEDISLNSYYIWQYKALVVISLMACSYMMA